MPLGLTASVAVVFLWWLRFALSRAVVGMAELRQFVVEVLHRSLLLLVEVLGCRFLLRE